MRMNRSSKSDEEGRQALLQLAYRLSGIDTEKLEEAGIIPRGLGRRGEALYIGLTGPNEETIDLFIESRDDDAEAYRKTRHLNLYYCSEPESGVAPAFLDRVARRLEGVRFEDLVNAWGTVPIGEGPLTGGDSLETDNDGVCPQDGIHETWAHPDRWRLFLAESEIRRGRDSVIQVEVPWIYVEHGDMECRYVGTGDFVRYPWRSPWYRTSDSGQTAPDPSGTNRPEKDSGPLGLCTDLEDVDVISGGEVKLAEVLGAIREEADPELVMVNCTCVPFMVGDDSADVVEKERARCSFPILYKEQEESHSPYDPHIDAVTRRLDAVQKKGTVEPDPHAVNLLGFQEGRALDELRLQLEEMDVRVNVTAVPRLDPGVMDHYLSAGTQVILDVADWRGLYRDVFADLPIRTLYLAAPYGPVGTRAWLEGVTSAAGRTDRFQALSRSIEDGLRQEWDLLVRRTPGRGIGFVVDERLARSVLEPALSYGLPLIDLLEEMGFGIHLAVYSKDLRPLPVEEAFLERVAHRGRHDVTYFADREQLGSFLRRSDVDLVYSDYTYDRRITGAGKVPFSTHVFEMGLPGAVRTLERLLTLCEMTFFAENRLYLQGEAS